MTESTLHDRLDAVVRTGLPGCKRLVMVERLSGGASQETYKLVIETASGEVPLAMRRTPGGVHVEPTPAHPGLEAEALLMQSARAAGVPEPEVHYLLQPGDELGDGFIMEWLEGEALGARIVRSERFDSIRPSLARECGRIMARIHAIDVQATGLDQHLANVSPGEFVEQTYNNYKTFGTPQPMIDYTARWLMENLPETYVPSLVHNDFRNGNFLLNEEGIVAVLDWELAHIGDPMRDLGWICVNSWRFGGDSPVGGFGSYEDLFAGYEEESGRVVDPATVKFWEVFGSFWWSVGCLSMAQHYRHGPDKTVERPAIARRSSECQVDCVNLLIPGAVSVLPLQPREDNIDMPRMDELVTSVRDFLRNDVMAATQGRNNFMARVAANSLDIVLREMDLGMRHKAAELARLQAFFDSADDLETLRWRLIENLRAGNQPLDDPALTRHLRESVVNQIAIDQPRYPGFVTATAGAGAS